MTPFPAPNRLHVWWARRPLVASRAAILASLLPAEENRDRFMHAIGIHGDPVAAKKAIEQARRTGVRIENPFKYPRAFNHTPDESDREWFDMAFSGGHGTHTVLDPTAGGGSIPLEAVRLGLVSLANDLNPVASVIMKATIEWPMHFPVVLKKEFDSLSRVWRKGVRERMNFAYPQRDAPDQIDHSYLYARTITCPYCDGLVPLSPNWRLSRNGTGVRLKPNLGKGPGLTGRVCSFEIVDSESEHSAGTVSRGDGTCPWEDCSRYIDGEEIKRQAQSGDMGEQLYAVVYKKYIPTILKSGKPGKGRWERGYREPRSEDDNSAEIMSALEDKLPEWEARDIIPTEMIPKGDKTTEPHRYGMPRWRDLFSPRQFLCHGASVEVFREMLDADRGKGKLDELREAAYIYLALSLDRMVDYNSRMCLWISQRGVIGHTFSQHDYSFKWSYVEMAPLVEGAGYDWAVKQTSKCIAELVNLIRSNASGGELLPTLDKAETDSAVSPATITCRSGDNLDHIDDASVDVVVMDPPYYDNVMYAELSDFFYVWLKRTAGYVVPQLFRRQLTDKESEAVANATKFQGQKNPKEQAKREYQKRMAFIFAECRRVLKHDGIMTLMFTHKAKGAWDALTKGLMEAGFIITASWPINTEASGSLHIKNKAAANSTIFLVCRPRPNEVETETDIYWEDLEPIVKEQVRKRVEEFQEAGISGVDLYLACFGPALEVFSRHWPLQRGTPREIPEKRRRQSQDELGLSEEEWDPYATSPEDALDAARREVKRWRLQQLAHFKPNSDLDPMTAFFVLAWDAFKAPAFAYDEALRLARAVGVDLDREIVGRLAEKKSGDIYLWDSSRRATKGTLGPEDGSRGMIDAIHHAAYVARERSLDAAREMVSRARVNSDPRFFPSFEALLEVLPVSQKFSRVKLTGQIAAASNDFEALYNLYRFAYGDKMDEPAQLKIWQETA